MNPISRRSLLRTTAVLPLALAGGCSFVQGVAKTDMPKVASDIGTIAGAVKTVEAGVEKLAALPARVKTAVLGWTSDLKKVAATVTADITTLASQPLVVRIEDDVKAVLQMGEALLPAKYTSIFKDALTVLGAVKSVIGLGHRLAAAPIPGEVEAARMRLVAAAQP